MKKYSIIKNIGNGSSGSVYLAKHNLSNKFYAIKKINFKNISDKDKDHIANEIKLLEDLNHPNIIQYIESFLDEENYFNIVMDYCDGGDIYNKVREMSGNLIPEDIIIDYIIEIGLALSYVHDKKFLHRDMKTQNIFIKNGHIMLGDFGIAKEYHLIKNLDQSMIGTPLYMSPEQYSGKKHGFKSDIWSFGCCLHEICNQKNTFEGSTWNGVALKVLKGVFAPINSYYSKNLRNLIEQMLSVNASKRPTISNILERNFIIPKTINYMVNYFLNFDNITDLNNETKLKQREIIKEQALKLGIFDLVQEETSKRRELIIIEQNQKVKEEITLINNIPQSNSLSGSKLLIESQIKILSNQCKSVIGDNNYRELYNNIKNNANENSCSNREFISLINQIIIYEEVLSQIDKLY